MRVRVALYPTLFALLVLFVTLTPCDEALNDTDGTAYSSGVHKHISWPI
jgi:hypothetical protein